MMWSPKLFYESLYVAHFWKKKAVKYVHICLYTCFNIDQRLFNTVKMSCWAWNQNIISFIPNENLLSQK